MTTQDDSDDELLKWIEDLNKTKMEAFLPQTNQALREQVRSGYESGLTDTQWRGTIKQKVNRN